MSIKRSSSIAFFVVCAFFIIGFMYQKVGRFFDDRRYPAPGKLVNIGGYRLHIQEAGSGLPTVIMDAGTGSFSLMWRKIPTEIAQFSHVYTYDKGGLGWSDVSPLPRTSKYMAQELHALLEAVHAPKPYILVGHSLGGGTIQLFANTYPDEVFGLVLIDSAHEQVPALIQKHNLTFKRTLTGFTVVHPQQEQDNASLSTRFHGLINEALRCPFMLHFLELCGLKRLYLTWFYTTPGHTQYPVYPQLLSRILRRSAFSTTSQEIAGYPQSAKDLISSEDHLKNKPLIVISNGKGFFYNPLNHRIMTDAEIEFNEKIWAPLQIELAKKSIKGKQIIAHNSGHRIQDTEPELIVQAIKELVEEYRKAQP